MIETERLSLRKPRLEDGHAFLALYTDPENKRSERVGERLGAVPRETVELHEHGSSPAVLWEHPA